MPADLPAREAAARGIYPPELERELKLPAASWPQRAINAALLTVAVALGAAAMALVLLACLAASAVRAEEFPNCRGFIPASCCCTNNCCFEIKPHEVIAVDPEGDEWMIEATGERIKRTAWSEDGKWYRCACELRDGKFVVDRKDRTRCIVPAKAEAGS